jgi:hypothetical protein
VTVARTAFYALDQEDLPKDDWDLADTFARLHSIATGGSSGVVRVTVADLMLALDMCERVEDSEETRAHRHAIARIRAALGPAGDRAH